MQLQAYLSPRGKSPGPLARGMVLNHVNYQSLVYIAGRKKNNKSINLLKSNLGWGWPSYSIRTRR